MNARLDYVELPVTNVAASKAFFEAAFGWSMTAFGPSYAATMSGDTDIGLQGDKAECSAAPLAIVRVDDLEASLAAVVANSGTITKPIFSFPGGRRFHFREPGGCELGVWIGTD